MTDTITVRGYVATDVRLTSAQSGLAIAGFRMCSTERRFDREANAWVDGHTNWYSVSMFRQLATHAGASIKKGDRVIVTGRLRVRPWSTADGRTGTSVEIDADTAGHDLMWGTANFRRTTADRTDERAATGQEDQPGGAGDGGPPEGMDIATGELYDTTPDFGEVGDSADPPGTGPADDTGRSHREEAVDTAGVPF